MDTAEFYAFTFFIIFIGGLAIYGNWLPGPPTLRPRSYFASGTTFMDLFGHDALDYFPAKIEATYRYWEEEIRDCSPSPLSDLDKLWHFHSQAKNVYEEALRRATEMKRDGEPRRGSEGATENTRSTRGSGSSQKSRKPKKPHGWRADLGLAADEADVTVVKMAYRRLVRKVHPDLRGNHDEAATVTRAYAEAKSELGFV